MSTTEEAQSAPAEPSAAEVQAPGVDMVEEEKMEVTSSTPAVAEPSPVASQPPTTESEPTKKDSTQSENVKTDNKTESSQFKVKPPVPKTIQTDRPLINPAKAKPKTVEQMEEAKLKAKFGGLHKPGGSQFLQQRLNKGMKYFDSGDYNMAKQSGKLKMRSLGGKPEIQPAPKPTGEAIPTPASIPHRKPSSEISKLAV